MDGASLSQRGNELKMKMVVAIDWMNRTANQKTDNVQ